MQSPAWDTLKTSLIQEFEIEGLDKARLDSSEKMLQSDEFRMRPNEGVLDFKRRLVALCNEVNRYRNRLAGEEPPKPEVVFQALHTLRMQSPEIQRLRTPRKPVQNRERKDGEGGEINQSESEDRRALDFDEKEAQHRRN